MGTVRNSQSWNRGNGLVGITIHSIRDQHLQTDYSGTNPFDVIKFDDGRALSTVVNTYDWVRDDGRRNLGRWVEEAYQNLH